MDSKRIAAGGVILVLLGLLPILGRVVAAVLGGAGVVLFGTVAASGILTLTKVETGKEVAVQLSSDKAI